MKVVTGNLSATGGSASGGKLVAGQRISLLAGTGCILILQILLLAAGALRAAAVTERDIYRVFRERGIPFDGDVARKSAVEGMLKAADGRARILSIEDAEKLGKGKTIEKAEEWPEGICYLKLDGLFEGGGSKVVSRLQTWVDTGRSGLIIDIRGSGGENLASVDEIVSTFVVENTVLYTVRDGNGRILETHSTREGTVSLAGIPLIVAIDGKTRDASEVLAAAMKGRDGVMLIGSRTSGDTGLRELIPLSDNELMHIATRWVVLPEGPEYKSVGVEPDIVVSDEKDDRSASISPAERDNGKPLSDRKKLIRELMQRVDGDAVLGRAADILLGLKALGVYDYAGKTVTNTADSAGQ